MNDDELLSAYLDGELSESDEVALQERLSEDPVLSESFNRMCILDVSVSRAYDQIQDTPHSAKLEALLRPTKVENIFLRIIDTVSDRVPYQFAAAVVLGCVFVLSSFISTSHTGIYVSQGVFGKKVSLILDSTLSHTTVALNSLSNIQPVLSYESITQEFCREYILSDQNKVVRGIACKNRTGFWEERISTSIPGYIEDSQYHTVAAPDTDILNSYIDKTMHGLPMSLDEELLVIQAGWKTK